MRRLLQRIDPGFLVILSISLIAIWPFISRVSLPEGTDAELHIFRLAELSYLLRGGEFYPRWAPNFYHGYGYPIFNYYAPLTYYLGFLVEILPSADPVFAIKVLFVLGMLMGGFGIYGFVRDQWGRRGGYVAAAVFFYAPYIQYIDPHARGVLPELFSFGVFPLALWSLDRLRNTGGRGPCLGSILLVSFVIMSHNLMGLLFFGILVGWAIWMVVISPHDSFERRIIAGRLFPALILGLGVAAIYWLPVIAERNAINLTTLIGEQDNYDFHTHFLTVKELFAPSIRLDWGATEPEFRFNLGIAQWLLGGMGITLLLLGKVKHARHLSYFSIALIVLVFLMLPLSTFLWDTLPFLPYFQFPWRFLGAISIMLAILGGAGAEGLLTLVFKNKAQDEQNATINKWRSGQTWITVSLVIFPILLGLPLSQPAPWPDFGEVNHLRMTLIENTGRWLGTTSTADYVPATVDTIPARKGSVVAPFAEGLPPDRVNWAMLPEGTEVKVDVIHPLKTLYTIDTPRPTRFRLFQFYFPGWEAKIDGIPVDTEIGRPEGFMVIPIPAGEHQVEVSFVNTLNRNVATVISLSSLVIMVVISLKIGTKPGLEFNRRFGDWPILLVVLLYSVLQFSIIEPSGVLHFNSEGNVAEPAQFGIYADFGDQIELLGYDANYQELAANSHLSMTLYWKALEELGINYQVFVHILGPDGLVAQSDKINPGEFPTKRWPIDKYVRDDHELILPDNLPPGHYEVAAGIWVQSDGWRLPVLDAQGNQVNDRLTLFTFEVE